MSDTLQWRLRERVKELTALHRMARLLQDTERPVGAVMQEVAELLPAAWQHSDAAEGAITCGDETWRTSGYRPTPWWQEETFTLGDGRRGGVCVAYRDEHPCDEGPFLREERDLLRSLADMVRAFLQHRVDDRHILDANERLEQQVAQRTASLRRLASELCLVEERERRQIAENLHDHLGQGLAVIKMRLQQLRGDAMLGGHGRALDELIALSDQAIRYTRELTFELSPPVLYELGLDAALEWLADDTRRRHGLPVRVVAADDVAVPDRMLVVLWKAARELVHNVLKHAGATGVVIRLARRNGAVLLEVADDGCGFDPAAARRLAGAGFGLFSIEERVVQLGGVVEVAAAPGAGARVTLLVPVTEGGA